jgi:hypothetical protein
VHIFDHKGTKKWDLKIPFKKNSHRPDVIVSFKSTYTAKDNRTVILEAKSDINRDSSHIRDIKLNIFPKSIMFR